MEREYLVDTNIFLEILLSQEKSDECKIFLEENIDNIRISDFSLHPIGVILFKFDKEDIFLKFCEDMQRVPVIGLSIDEMQLVTKAKQEYNLDFDDGYQYALAKSRKLTIKSLDEDFDKTDIERV